MADPLNPQNQTYSQIPSRQLKRQLFLSCELPAEIRLLPHEGAAVKHLQPNEHPRAVHEDKSWRGVAFGFSMIGQKIPKHTGTPSRLWHCKQTQIRLHSNFNSFVFGWLGNLSQLYSLVSGVWCFGRCPNTEIQRLLGMNTATELLGHLEECITIIVPSLSHHNQNT